MGETYSSEVSFDPRYGRPHGPSRWRRRKRDRRFRETRGCVHHAAEGMTSENTTSVEQTSCNASSHWRGRRLRGSRRRGCSRAMRQTGRWGEQFATCHVSVTHGDYGRLMFTTMRCLSRLETVGVRGRFGGRAQTWLFHGHTRYWTVRYDTIRPQPKRMTKRCRCLKGPHHMFIFRLLFPSAI